MNMHFIFILLIITTMLALVTSFLFCNEMARLKIVNNFLVIGAFVLATITFIRLAPITIGMVCYDLISFSLITFQLLMLGYASGFRTLSIFMALVLTALLTAIGMCIYISQQWLFLPMNIYWIFGFSYLMVVAKAEQNWWFEKFLLSFPRSKFLIQYYASFNKATLELMFKTQMVTATNILFELPYGEGAISLLLWATVFLNLVLSYHLIGFVKLPYFVVSTLEIFHSAHLSSQQAKYNSVPANLIRIVEISFYALIIGPFYYAFLDVFELGYSYSMGNSVPRIHIWSGFQSGIRRYLETRFSHEAVENFTVEQLNAITDHFWKHRFKYGAATAAYANSDTYKQWYDSCQLELDKILKR